MKKKKKFFPVFIGNYTLLKALVVGLCLGTSQGHMLRDAKGIGDYRNRPCLILYNNETKASTKCSWIKPAVVVVYQVSSGGYIQTIGREATVIITARIDPIWCQPHPLKMTPRLHTKRKLPLL